MKRSEMIKQLVAILDTIPNEASSWHIVDMLLGAVEKRGMRPVRFETYDIKTGWDREDEE